MGDTNNKNILYLSISSLVFMFSSYITTVWLGRSLGPINYGIYGVVISLINILNLVQSYGLPLSLSKRLAEEPTNSNSILRTGIILQILSTLVIMIFYFISAPLITEVLNDYSLLPYLRFSVFILPFYGMYSLYLGYYNGIHAFKKQAALNNLYSVSKLITIVLLGYLFSLTGVFIAFIMSPLIALLFFLHLPKPSLVNYPYKHLILFALPLVGLSIITTVQQTIDLYFVKALLTYPEAPGYYTASQNIARIPFIALSSFAAYLYPKIARNLKSNLHLESKKLINDALRWVLLLLIPGTLIISATSKELLRIIFSEAYVAGSNSLSLLIFGFGFFTIFNILANIINSTGKPNISLLISLVGVLLTVILCYWLVPVIGLSGAAIATTTGAFISMMLAAVYVYKMYGVLVSARSVRNIVFASLIPYFLIKNILWVSNFLPLFYVTFVVLYILLLVLIQEVTRNDFTRIRELFSTRYMPKFLRTL